VRNKLRTGTFLLTISFLMMMVGILQPLGAQAASHPLNHHLLKTKHAVGPKASAGNLRYHGGPVIIDTANAYAIFWEPTGSYVSSSYNSLILQYFGDVGGSTLYRNSKQYKNSSGGYPSNAVLAGSWIDTHAYPSGTLSDAQIQGEVTRAQSKNGWQSSINNIFFVFTAKGENICDGRQCSFTSFCAYHSSFGSDTLYAAVSYTGTNLSACGVPTSPNHNVDADSTINVTSHEQMEATTDPLGTAWYDLTGYEIADKCAWKFGTTSAQGGDVAWNGRTYEVQEEWDNAKSGCVLAGP
jgi:hypothetical protein